MNFTSFTCWPFSSPTIFGDQYSFTRASFSARLTLSMRTVLPLQVHTQLGHGDPFFGSALQIAQHDLTGRALVGPDDHRPRRATRRRQLELLADRLESQAVLDG